MANTFRNELNQQGQNILFAYQGQLFEGSEMTTHIFPKGQDTEWLPRNKHREFLDELGVRGFGKGCMTVWLSGSRVCYSMCRRLSGRSGSDTEAAMLCSTTVAEDTARLLSNMNSMLDDLTKIVMEKKKQSDIDDNKLAEYLNNIKDAFGKNTIEEAPKTEAVQNVSKDVSKQGNNIPKEAAFIEYSDESSLQSVLRWLPYQSFMHRYEYVHLVHRNDRERAGVPMGSTKCIEIGQEQVKRSYRFALPDNGVAVADGKKYLQKGDTFRLEYSKKGLVTHIQGPIKLQSTSSSPYYTISETDGIIEVKPYDKERMGWVFKMRYGVRVVDSNTGKEIEKWQWVGKKAAGDNGSGNFIELDEGKYELEILASGYKKGTINVEPEDRDRFVTCKLEPEGFEVKLSLIPSWGKAKGAKAEMLVVQGKQTDVFARYHKRGIRGITYYVSRSHPLLIVVLAALLAGGAGFYVGHLLWPIEKPVEKQEVKIPKEEVAKESGVPNKVESPSSDKPEVTEETKEKADLAYLNNNKNWVRDSLQSTRYLFLYDTILPNKVKWSDHKDYYEEITLNEWREFVGSYRKKDMTKFTNEVKEIKEMQRKGNVDWNTVKTALSKNSGKKTGNSVGDNGKAGLTNG